MLANQSDFMAYAGALKSNYRKGVHRMEAILSNPTHAKEFAANLGGVSVVLGVPVDLPDRNSDKLLELLLGSTVADDAVETWLHQFYEFTGWDDLLSDSARCKEMANNPLIWRAVGGSKLAVGKSIATLAGLSCSAYKDIDAVAASSTAMAAVAASSTAMAAIQKSPTALNAIAASSMATAKYAAGAAGLNPADYADMKAVAASSTAMAAVAASSTAMTAIIANSTALNAVVTSSTAMAAIVAAPVAMAALWRSDTAIKALQANATAWKTFTGASSSVMGKTVAILAGLNPSSYADMTAIAASSTAMTAIIANSTALNTVVTSSTAMAAVAASSTAMTAVAASSTAMAAIIANSTALNAVVTSSTAMAAVVNSTTACRAIESSATAIAAMNAASGFVEVTNQVCQANSSMSVALINKKAWVSQYWNTSSDTNTSQSMLIGVNVVGGGSTNIGNFSVARTRKSVNKFVSSIRIATTYGSALSYGGIRYKPLS